MAYISPNILTKKDFLSQYRDNPRYELADGELIDMEPTGSHETVGGKIATRMVNDFSWRLRGEGRSDISFLPSNYVGLTIIILGL